MVADCRAEVHVGDVGTLYQVRMLDECLDFDPSTSTTKELIFEMPGGVVLTKTATLTNNGSPASKWYLTYVVLAGAGQATSPPSEFHAAAGKVKIQAHLAGPGHDYHSVIVTTDDDGNELRVYANLA